MTFTKVKHIPKATRNGKKGGGRVQRFIEEFYNSGIKYAKVDIEEGRYKTLKGAQTAFICSNKRLGGLPVKTVIRGNELYIVRTDMK